MRRHRYVRSGYRAGTVKKSRKKLLVRIAFVLGCALALTLFSVLLGSYLNKKAEESLALSSNTSITEETSENIDELFPEGVPVKDPDEAKRELCGADIDISSGDADHLRELIDGLSDKYNAVSIRITSAEGKLAYISPALMEYVGMDSSLADTKVTLAGANTSEDGDEEPAEAFDTFENLCAVIEAAKERGLRTVALFSTDSSSLELSATALSKCEIDSVIAGELFSLGCDEILIDGLFEDEGQIPHETLKAMIRYLAVLRSRSSDMLIGINFPDNVYLIPQNASVIKTLSEYADFLAISIGTSVTDPSEAYSAVYDNCYSLKGNFSMYNLRGIIQAEDTQLSSAIFASLKELSAKSFQFTVYVADPVFTISGDTPSTDGATETGVSNDNANRKEDYENTETSAEDPQ